MLQAAAETERKLPVLVRGEAGTGAVRLRDLVLQPTSTLVNGRGVWRSNGGHNEDIVLSWRARSDEWVLVQRRPSGGDVLHARVGGSGPGLLPRGETTWSIRGGEPNAGQLTLSTGEEADAERMRQQVRS